MGRYFSSTQSRTAWRIVFSSSLNRSSMRTKSTPLKTAMHPPEGRNRGWALARVDPGNGARKRGRGDVGVSQPDAPNLTHPAATGNRVELAVLGGPRNGLSRPV